MSEPSAAGPGPGRDEIVAILAAFGDRPPEEVPEGIDSMELAWLVHQIEQRYGGSVDDDGDVPDDDRVRRAPGAGRTPPAGRARRSRQPVSGMSRSARRGGGWPGCAGAPRPSSSPGPASSAPSATGRPVLAAALDGRPGFAPVRRFGVAARRPSHAAAHPGTPVLADELARMIGQACDRAGLSAAQRAGCPLHLAVHGDPALPRAARGRARRTAPARSPPPSPRRGGLSGAVRAYTSACVASSTAVADAAALVARGRAERIVVAAGYLVEADQFAVFDAGAGPRPRRPGPARSAPGAAGCCWATRWSRSWSSRPPPPGTAGRGRWPGWPAGAARATPTTCQAAARRRRTGPRHRRRAAPRGLRPGQIGYVNAHGSGSPAGDAAESAALYRAFGDPAEAVPVSSTKSVHGQALEAGALLELVVTISALRAGRLPVNAGWLGPDPDCRLGLVLDRPAPNAAYAPQPHHGLRRRNTALLVGTPMTLLTPPGRPSPEQFPLPAEQVPPPAERLAAEQAPSGGGQPRLVAEACLAGWRAGGGGGVSSIPAFGGAVGGRAGSVWGWAVSARG